MEVERAVLARLRHAGATEEALAGAVGLFRPARLTGGAEADWIVDFAAVPTGRLCGTGGCPVQVWTRGYGGRYRLVFDRQALGHAVVAAPPRLELELHGVHCGGTGSDPCRQSFSWRGGRLVRVKDAGPRS